MPPSFESSYTVEWVSLARCLGCAHMCRCKCTCLLITTRIFTALCQCTRGVVTVNYITVETKSVSLLIQYRLFQYIMVPLTFMWSPGSPSTPCLHECWVPQDVINLRHVSASFFHTLHVSSQALTSHSPWAFELQFPVKFGVCQGPAGRRDTHVWLARASRTGLCTGGSLISTGGWQNWVVGPSVLLAINPFLSCFKRQDETARKRKNQIS